MGYTLHHPADLRIPAGDSPGPATAALGDWHAARLNIGWHRLVMCVSSNGLIPVVTVARTPGLLPSRLAAGLDRLLRHHGLDVKLIDREVESMASWVTAPASDQPVIVATIREYGWAARDILDAATGPITLDDVSVALVARAGLAPRLPALLGR